MKKKSRRNRKSTDDGANDINSHDAYIVKCVKKLMIGVLSDNDRKIILKDLSKMYQNGYRHSYYDITKNIYEYLYNCDDKRKTINYLKNNMITIRNDAFEEYISDLKIVSGFRKLYDHILLEVTRLEDSINDNEIIEYIIEKHENELNKSVRNGIEKSEEVSKEAVKKIKKLEENILSQITSVLGIFAAIIFVFFGGTQLFSNALKGIHLLDKSDIGILGFVISLIGLIMFDTIFMLLYVISVISGKPLSSDKGTHTECYLTKLKKKFPFLVWMNIIFFGLIGISLFLISKKW